MKSIGSFFLIFPFKNDLGIVHLGRQPYCFLSYVNTKPLNQSLLGQLLSSTAAEGIEKRYFQLMMPVLRIP